MLIKDTIEAKVVVRRRVATRQNDIHDAATGNGQDLLANCSLIMVFPVSSFT